jgi:phosphatidylglycerophosphate synthase
MLTLPNALSLSRIALAPALVVAVANRAEIIVVGIFILVVISDFLDGYIARRRALASNLGALIDHSSDAIFVTVMTGQFAYLGLLPPALPLAISIAFVQYSLDSRESGRMELRASTLGRYNGIAYFVITALAIFVHLFVPYSITISVIYWLGWLLVFSSLVSISLRAAHFFATQHT